MSALSIVELSIDLERKLFGSMSRGMDFDIYPSFTVPAGFLVKVIYPYGGAAIRFHIIDERDHDNYASVYLDMKSCLGSGYDPRTREDVPYYEAFISRNNECYRFNFDSEDFNRMMDFIYSELKKESGNED